jgi:hypothetical protein
LDKSKRQSIKKRNVLYFIASYRREPLRSEDKQNHLPLIVCRLLLADGLAL